MRSSQIPLFRRAIAPWYDSEAVCVVVVIFAAMVLGFGVLGALAARETPAYEGFIWVPVSLVLLSAFVLISIIVRLVARNRRRPSIN